MSDVGGHHNQRVIDPGVNIFILSEPKWTVKLSKSSPQILNRGKAELRKRIKIKSYISPKVRNSSTNQYQIKVGVLLRFQTSKNCGYLPANRKYFQKLYVGTNFVRFRAEKLVC